MTGPSTAEPTREMIDTWPGMLVLEFGAGWCPHCQALQPVLSAALREFPQVQHRWVEDGKGRPLGRSFRVKWWPTLLFLKDGQVIARLERPDDAQVRQALQMLTTSSGPIS